MKALAAVLIAAGIITALYPFLSREVKSYQEQQLLNQWDTQQTVTDIPTYENRKLAEKSYARLTDIFAKESQAAEKDNDKQQPDLQRLLGTIEIDKIGVRLPILEGASLDNLRIAAGHLSGTAPIGAKGNSAIAAHDSYTYGRQFNRLQEVEQGDDVAIETKDHKYIYTIYQKQFAAPTDMSVLNGDGSRRLLTLVTCHHMKNRTNRLLVEAELTSIDGMKESRE